MPLKKELKTKIKKKRTILLFSRDKSSFIFFKDFSLNDIIFPKRIFFFLSVFIFAFFKTKIYSKTYQLAANNPRFTLQ